MQARHLKIQDGLENIRRIDPVLAQEVAQGTTYNANFSNDFSTISGRSFNTQSEQNLQTQATLLSVFDLWEDHFYETFEKIPNANKSAWLASNVPIYSLGDKKDNPGLRSAIFKLYEVEAMKVINNGFKKEDLEALRNKIDEVVDIAKLTVEYGVLVANWDLRKFIDELPKLYRHLNAEQKDIASSEPEKNSEEKKVVAAKKSRQTIGAANNDFHHLPLLSNQLFAQLQHKAMEEREKIAVRYKDSPYLMEMAMEVFYKKRDAENVSFEKFDKIICRMNRFMSFMSNEREKIEMSAAISQADKSKNQVDEAKQTSKDQFNDIQRTMVKKIKDQILMLDALIDNRGNNLSKEFQLRINDLGLFLRQYADGMSMSQVGQVKANIEARTARLRAETETGTRTTSRVKTDIQISGMSASFKESFAKGLSEFLADNQALFGDLKESVARKSVLVKHKTLPRLVSGFLGLPPVGSRNSSESSSPATSSATSSSSSPSSAADDEVVRGRSKTRTAGHNRIQSAGMFPTVTGAEPPSRDRSSTLATSQEEQPKGLLERMKRSFSPTKNK